MKYEGCIFANVVLLDPARVSRQQISQFSAIIQVVSFIFFFFNMSATHDNYDKWEKQVNKVLEDACFTYEQASDGDDNQVFSVNHDEEEPDSNVVWDILDSVSRASAGFVECDRANKRCVVRRVCRQVRGTKYCRRLLVVALVAWIGYMFVFFYALVRKDMENDRFHVIDL